MVAMLFIMFDIEIIFAYPFAIASSELGTYGFWEFVAFSAVFFVAFVYVVARGALDWGPINKPRQLLTIDDDIFSASRTTATTIRRVGLDGRRTEKVSS